MKMIKCEPKEDSNADQRAIARLVSLLLQNENENNILTIDLDWYKKVLGEFK